MGFKFYSMYMMLLSVQDTLSYCSPNRGVFLLFEEILGDENKKTSLAVLVQCLSVLTDTFYLAPLSLHLQGWSCNLRRQRRL